MASSNNSIGRDEEVGEDGDEDETVEELQRFDDFTLASSWERFISDIEAVCRLWMADGPKNLMDKGAENLSSLKNLYKVKSEVKYGSKAYCMEYYFEVSSHGEDSKWHEDLHNLQLLFGVKDFMVVTPLRVSGVVLDAPEASKLLSSVAIALSNCGSIWPAFVPVHDPSRKAYIGIQNMGMTFTRRFETDRVGSQVPIRLMHLEGLYELFVSKFALYVTDISTRVFNVHCTMKLTYKTTPYNDGDDIGETEVLVEKDTNGEMHLKKQWDDDCPWTEWYSAEEPVKGFQLVAVWSDMMVGSSFEMAEIENASSLDAERWLLSPILLSHLNDDSGRNPVGFASQLQNLVNALNICFDAKFVEDFMSVENPGSDNLGSSNSIPPPTVIDRVLKDLFHEVPISRHPKHENSNSRSIKGAPLESLFAQFCLHALWFGTCNIRAIAVLWIEFVKEVRWCWEESEALTGVPTGGGIDLSTCLIHQKLQMLAICIEKKEVFHDLHENIETEVDSYNNKGESQVVESQSTYPSYSAKLKEENASSVSIFSGSKESNKMSNTETENSMASANLRSSDHERRGSSGPVGSMMLLCSYQNMHAPYTQDPPIMTEDMHEERLHTIEAIGDSYASSAILERHILSSDMSAFKAANPDAVFEDFIRWHSPVDWESSEVDKNCKPIESDAGSSKSHWPPRGRLSQRMSERGNSWKQIWNDSPPLPASLQKPLLDPIREGEKILHYLETLSPQQLLGQMICTTFRASLDTLNQTSYGKLKHMKTKIGQLYLTLASSLKPLKGNNWPDKAELISDLRRLCVVFGHIEKLITFAASIHRKMIDVPRLSEAIFNEYFDFYLPRLGTSSASICYDKEFVCNHYVKRNERDHVAKLFPPPTANQSWRKVLSMGNLLNGHEPILREIIFSTCDEVGSGRYGAGSPQGSHLEMETHRMYVCGTSNELQVALSVISWD